MENRYIRAMNRCLILFGIIVSFLSINMNLFGQNQVKSENVWLIDHYFPKGSETNKTLSKVYNSHHYLMQMIVHIPLPSPPS